MLSATYFIEKQVITHPPTHQHSISLTPVFSFSQGPQPLDTQLGLHFGGQPRQRNFHYGYDHRDGGHFNCFSTKATIILTDMSSVEHGPFCCIPGCGTNIFSVQLLVGAPFMRRSSGRFLLTCTISSRSHKSNINLPYGQTPSTNPMAVPILAEVRPHLRLPPLIPVLSTLDLGSSMPDDCWRIWCYAIGRRRSDFYRRNHAQRVSRAHRDTTAQSILQLGPSHQ